MDQSSNKKLNILIVSEDCQDLAKLGAMIEQYLNPEKNIIDLTNSHLCQIFTNKYIKEFKLAHNNYFLNLNLLKMVKNEIFFKLTKYHHVIILINQNINLRERLGMETTFDFINYCMILQIPQIIFAYNIENIQIEERQEQMKIMKQEIRKIIQEKNYYSYDPQITFFVYSTLNINSLFSLQKQKTNNKQQKPSLVEHIIDNFTPCICKYENSNLRLLIQEVLQDIIKAEILFGILTQDLDIFINQDFAIFKVLQIKKDNQLVQQAKAGDWVDLKLKGINLNPNQIFVGKYGFSTQEDEEIGFSNVIQTQIQFFKEQNFDDLKKESLSLQNFCGYNIQVLRINEFKPDNSNKKKDFLNDLYNYEFTMRLDFFYPGQRFVVLIKREVVGIATVKQTSEQQYTQYSAILRHIYFPRKEFLMENKVDYQPLYDKCRICLENSQQVIFKPCGHTRYCLLCSKDMINCGFCEQKILAKASFQVVFDKEKYYFNKCQICKQNPFSHIKFKEEKHEQDLYLCENCVPEQQGNKRKQSKVNDNLFKITL